MTALPAVSQSLKTQNACPADMFIVIDVSRLFLCGMTLFCPPSSHLMDSSSSTNDYVSIPIEPVLSLSSYLKCVTGVEELKNIRL